MLITLRHVDDHSRPDLFIRSHQVKVQVFSSFDVCSIYLKSLIVQHDLACVLECSQSEGDLSIQGLVVEVDIEGQVEVVSHDHINVGICALVSGGRSWVEGVGKDSALCKG